ncbi:MAG: hypothetical protein ACFB2Z_14645 [Maricaulaceae bacterium]
MTRTDLDARAARFVNYDAVLADALPKRRKIASRLGALCWLAAPEDTSPTDLARKTLDVFETLRASGWRFNTLTRISVAASAAAAGRSGAAVLEGYETWRGAPQLARRLLAAQGVRAGGLGGEDRLDDLLAVLGPRWWRGDKPVLSLWAAAFLVEGVSASALEHKLSAADSALDQAGVTGRKARLARPAIAYADPNTLAALPQRYAQLQEARRQDGYLRKFGPADLVRLAALAEPQLASHAAIQAEETLRNLRPRLSASFRPALRGPLSRALIAPNPVQGLLAGHLVSRVEQSQAAAASGGAAIVVMGSS